MVVSEIDLINELAAEIAAETLTEAINDEYEAMLDEMFAEHQAMQYAANSWDLDAQFYGDPIYT